MGSSFSRLAFFDPLDATGNMQWRNSAVMCAIDPMKRIIGDLESQVVNETNDQALDTSR